MRSDAIDKFGVVNRVAAEEFAIPLIEKRNRPRQMARKMQNREFAIAEIDQIAICKQFGQWRRY